MLERIATYQWPCDGAEMRRVQSGYTLVSPAPKPRTLLTFAPPPHAPGCVGCLQTQRRYADQVGLNLDDFAGRPLGTGFLTSVPDGDAHDGNQPAPPPQDGGGLRAAGNLFRDTPIRSSFGVIGKSGSRGRSRDRVGLDVSLELNGLCCWMHLASDPRGGSLRECRKRCLLNCWQFGKSARQTGGNAANDWPIQQDVVLLAMWQCKLPIFRIAQVKAIWQGDLCTPSRFSAKKVARGKPP